MITSSEPDARYRICHNPETASFEDLLAVLLSHGQAGRNVKQLSNELARLARTESGLFEMEAGALSSIKGLGPAKVSVIMAAIELARRKSRTNLKNGDRMHPELLARWLYENLQGRAEEFYYLFTYNRNFVLVQRHLLNKGNPDGVQTLYRSLLKHVLNDRCSLVIIAHNHPDDDARPSNVDIDNLEILRDLLDPLGIKVSDQYIVGPEGVFSCINDDYVLELNASQEQRWKGCF